MYALPKFKICIIANNILKKIAEIQRSPNKGSLKQGKDNGKISE